MNPRKRNTTLKAKKDRVEEEIILAKHCHTLIIRLPFLKNETVKNRDLKKLIKKLGQQQLSVMKRAKRSFHAQLRESSLKVKVPTKWEGKVMKRSNTIAHKSRKTRHYKQNKLKHFVGPSNTKSHACKVENDSIMELSLLKGRMPAKNRISKNEEHRACLVNLSTKSINSVRDSSECSVRLTYNSYVSAFKRYLNVLGSKQKIDILYQLAKRSISSKFFIKKKNASSELVLNKRLIEWIIGQILEKDVLIMEPDEIIKSAIREAEESDIGEFEESEQENEIQREQMAQADKNALVNQYEVPKCSNTILERKVEAVIPMRVTVFRSENLGFGKKILAPDNKLFHSRVKETFKADKMDILLEKYFPLAKSQNVVPSGEPNKVFITENNNTPKNMASVSKAKTCCFAAIANGICSCPSSGNKFIPSTAGEKNNLSFITDYKPNEECDDKICGEGDCRRLEKCGGSSCIKCKIQLITNKGVYYSFKPLDRPIDPKTSGTIRILRSDHISYLSRLKFND